MAENKLTPEQQAVVENRGGPLLVSAAAGSGKTFVLVKRLMDRVQSGEADIDDFLIITFTKAAASELRGRILADLNRRIAQDPGNSRLRRQTALVHRADIGTIDSFCAGLLRRWAWALDISPDFRQLDEDESNALRERVMEDLLESRYREGDAGFLHLADTVGTGRDDRGLAQAVLALYRSTESLPDPLAWLEEQKAAALAAPLARDPIETPWGRFFLNSRQELLESRVREMEAAFDEMGYYEKILDRYASTFMVDIQSGKDLHAAMGESWEAARAVSETIGFSPLPALRYDGPEKDLIKEVRNRYKDFVLDLTELLSAPAQTVMADLALSARAVCPLLDLTADFYRNFSREKRRCNLMDFADTERLALQILENPATGGEIAGGYVEVMVDEYQDINRLQERLFSALSGDGQRLFMVGDVKQSIYAFRLATPDIFLEKYTGFDPYLSAAPGRGRKIDLNLNFRSRSAVLEAVNYVCATVMSPRLGGLVYDSHQALHPGAEFAGEDPPVELTFIDTKDTGHTDDDKEGESTEEAPEEGKSLAEARWAAARVHRLIHQEGYAPEDIAILLRATTGRAYLYREALGELGIPCVSAASEELLETPEARVLMSILEVVDNPFRDIPLTAMLLSPIWGFSPKRLAEIRAKCRDLSLYEALQADGGADTGAFLRDLEALRADSRTMTADRLVWKLLTHHQMLLIYGARGEQARENLLTICAWAEKCRAQGHITLYDFLGQLRTARENGRTAPPPAQGGSAVKIMSVHRSKGLEFKVVLLCGLGTRFNRLSLDEPVLFEQSLGVGIKLYDKETLSRRNSLPRLAIREKLKRQGDSEELRILYVGMTRAKERLILSAAPTSMDALLARAGRGFLPVSFALLSGASSPAVWLAAAALARPEGRALMGNYIEPAPGRWDIKRISLKEALDGVDAAGEKGAQESLPPAAISPECIARGLGWRYPYGAATAIASKMTPSALEDYSRPESRLPYVSAPESQNTAAPYPLPGFLSPEGLTAAEKGTALHLVMQHIDLSQCGSLEGIEREIARLELQAFITPLQARAADPRRVLAFFASALGQQVLKGKPIREFKFSVLMDAAEYFPDAPGEKILIQGMIDLYYRLPGGLGVVDFKTDRVPPEGEAALVEKHRPQVETYAAALEKITGEKVLEKHLYFFSINKSFLL